MNPGETAVTKRGLRAHYRALRASIPPEWKKRWDREILEGLLSLETYRACETLLCYIPLPGEIDTEPLIADAWQRRKRVAAPYCVPGTRLLEFYPIASLVELREGTYGVREPDPSRGEPLTHFAGALLIAPGLSFDREGFRLGYGGGYYDRFMAGPYAGHPAVGVCYSLCRADRLPRDKYDLPCGAVIWGGSSEQGESPHTEASQGFSTSF